MAPVGPGTQKITQDSAERDYQSKLLAAQRQHGQVNPFVAGEQQGIENVLMEGSGKVVTDSRDPKYSNVTQMPQDVAQGANSNFAQGDFPGNNISGMGQNTTGIMDSPVGGISATTDPEQDPTEFTGELQKRLMMYQQAGNAYNAGNNDRSVTGSLR
jgi:hypothetical protein